MLFMQRYFNIRYHQLNLCLHREPRKDVPLVVICIIVHSTRVCRTKYNTTLYKLVYVSHLSKVNILLIKRAFHYLRFPPSVFRTALSCRRILRADKSCLCLISHLCLTQTTARRAVSADTPRHFPHSKNLCFFCQL